jgi:hypothetical protein
MTPTIRPADNRDLEPMADLLLAGARARAASNPGLWALAREPREQILTAIAAEIGSETPAFRQQWLVAEEGGTLVGVTHSMLLPIPPIYAGELGPPGLIMEDSFVSPDASPETRRDLLRAAEADLVGAGARLLLASSIAGGTLEDEYLRQGFNPQTLYFARTRLDSGGDVRGVRAANENDLPNIDVASRANRRLLQTLHPVFWKPHADADARFAGWMKHCLTLADRDMLVSEADGLRGYAMAQPATRLHFPIPHEIGRTAVIDDFFHEELDRADAPSSPADKALALLKAAEAARGKRGDLSVLVVCPAAWTAKIALLKEAGYRPAITWFIKIKQ